MRGTYDEPEPIEFLDEKIEWSDSYKHLGVIMQSKLNLLRCIMSLGGRRIFNLNKLSLGLMSRAGDI